MTTFNWIFFFNRRIFHASQGRSITLAAWVFTMWNSNSYQTGLQMRKISKVSTGMFIYLQCFPFLACVDSFKGLFSLECLFFFFKSFCKFLSLALRFYFLSLMIQIFEINLFIIKQAICQIYTYFPVLYNFDYSHFWYINLLLISFHSYYLIK